MMQQRWFRSLCYPALLLLPLTSESHAETLAPTKPKSADVIQFDVDSLKSLGYSAEVADFFKQGSQFLPGQYDVVLIVNGSARYPALVTIGEHGELCVTPTLQETLKLKDNAITAQTDCVDFTAVYPGAQVLPHPNEYTLDITVAETDFDNRRRGRDLTTGGFALLSNYRVYSMQMKNGQGDNQKFYQGQFDSGINWHNWILRNNSSFSSGRDNTEYQFNETTLTRSIVPLQSQLQMGQISSQGSLFAGTPLNGAQIYSDSALDNSNQLVVPVTGIAESAATVEVSQNGRLLYRTLVPAGPFSLDRINNVVSGQPLQVAVIQDDGRNQQFTVTTATRQNANTASSAYQFAVGQYRKRNSREDIDTPLVVSLEGHFRKEQTEYTAGTLISEYYQGIGGRLNRQWLENKTLASDIGSLIARSTDKRGAQLDGSLNQMLGQISIGISALYQTKDYPTLDNTVQKDTQKIAVNVNDLNNQPNWVSNQLQSSSSAHIGWSDIAWGRIGYTLGYNHYYGDKADSVMHTISYGTKIRDLSMNLSFQSGNDRDNRVFLNLSMPLGRKASVSAQIQRYHNDTNLNTTFNHRPSDLWGYSIGASRNSNQTRFNGSLNATTPYSQINASGSWSDENTQSMMLSAAGAVVYADGMVATSPIAVGNTFGVIRVPNQSGVRISSMGGGTTVTNYFGTAVIPTLPVNHKTTVQLDTKKLPLNVRLAATSFDVAVESGTVISREIGATVMKQLLLGITLPDGTPAPSGASVFDA
ncbi:fimbria/pilus outer membrane usher protein [Providencia manganoxydans]